MIMVGENGTPEATPDWDLELVLRQRLARDTGVRHDLRDVCARFGVNPDCPCESTCDVCDGEMNRSSAHGYGVYPLPERIELGEN